MAQNKTRPGQGSVKAFIDSVANETRRQDAKTLLKLMRTITGKRATLWGPSIVGFGKYHYRYDSGREGDMFMTGFSPRKQNTVVYIVSGFREHAALLRRLGKHKTGKSCLYINKLADVDMDVLETLIRKSMDYLKAKYPG